jgi:energy-coupling factor transport system ATP-binding protein
VVVSTHDVEFAALTTSRVVLLADGEIVADGDAHDVCTSSPAYSPQMAKVFAPLRLLTPDEVAAGL